MTNQWNLKVVSINVNGIASEMWTKLRSLHRSKFDIILLQETKLKDADLNDDLLYRWGQVSDGEAFSSPAASSQSGGVAVLLSSYACSILHDREKIPIQSDGHRQIIVSASLNEQRVYLQSIYAPARRADRPDFFNNLTNPTTPGSHIIGGDFNCVIDANIDTISDPVLVTTGTPEMITWMDSLDVIDAWRTQNDNKTEFTSPSGNSRIDMVLLSGCFTNHFHAHHLPRLIGSDHMVPQIETKSCEISSGNGHWQLPTWLASKAATEIKPMLETLASAIGNSDYSDTFTKVMRNITGRCKAVHKQVLRWRKDKIERARLRWLRAHHRAIASPTEERIADAEEARRIWKKAIDDAIYLKRARAFDKHFAEAERCTAFFLRRPRKKNVSTIPGVRKPDGSTSEAPETIQSEHKSYWSTLYSIDSGGLDAPLTNTNIQNLTNTSLPKLSNADAAVLEQPITEEEIERQITRLPNNKAAGSDGLRAELLKQHPALWSKILLPIFEHQLHQLGQLPQSFRESIVILLHKKGCALTPKNYRPIALLNVIAKVLSGIHNNRLRRVIKKIIPPEQTGFVPQRSISENLLLLQDSIYYAKRHHPSSIVVSLDFEKAYDRVQWKAMNAVIQKLNFGPRWCTIIKTMYKDRSARLSINGDLSNSFPIQRGVLQGDPLSPALFIIQCSPLYAKLNDMRNAHGIPLPDNNAAPVATFYADDTNLIAKSPASAVALYDTAKWFCANSGAKIHPDKCTAIPTGPAPLYLSNGIKVLNPYQDTMILGVPLGMHITRYQQTQRIVTKMINRCNSFAHIGRTLEGRVTIARAMILSTLWYVLGAIPTNTAETKKIQAMIYNYLNGREEYEWDGPTLRGNIARPWFHRPKREGGWNLAPVLRTLRSRKLALLRSIIVDNDNGVHKPWHTFIKVMLKEHMDGWSEKWQDIVYWNGTQKQGDFAVGRWDALSPWWRETWQEWLKLKCTPDRHSFSRSQLRGWPVWNNRLLASNHGIDSVLYRAFSNSATRTHMRTFRTHGFLRFQDFMGDNDAIMSGHQLYTAITVTLSVHGSDHIIPLGACEALSRLLQAVWSNTTKNWLRQSAHNPQRSTTKWRPPNMPNISFSTASNNTISKLIMESEPVMNKPRLISLNSQPITMSWARENKILSQLAPTRRDLLKRLTRNALPLGYKRIHWNTQCQVNCLLCDANTVETARHIFWECTFARQVWGNLHCPWRNQVRTQVGWREVLMGYEVRAGPLGTDVTEQLWSIVRGCTMRTIWLERNRRYFYPELEVRSARFRHNQAMADIRAHTQAWMRRGNEDDTARVSNAINYITSRATSLNFLQGDQPSLPDSSAPHPFRAT